MNIQLFIPLIQFNPTLTETKRCIVLKTPPHPKSDDVPTTIVKQMIHKGTQTINHSLTSRIISNSKRW